MKRLHLSTQQASFEPLAWIHSQCGCLVTSPTVSQGWNTFPLFSCWDELLFSPCCYQVTAYGGELRYTVRYEPFQRSLVIDGQPDVVLQGNGIFLEHFSQTKPLQRVPQTITVTFREVCFIFHWAQLIWNLHIIRPDSYPSAPLADSLHGDALTGSHVLASTFWWHWPTCLSSWSGPPMQTTWLRAGRVSSHFFLIFQQNCFSVETSYALQVNAAPASQSWPCINKTRK